MKSILIVIQLITSAGLIVFILLHSAKGEGLGGIGGAAKLFGTPKGMEEGLDKITTSAAIVFVIVSLLLNFIK